MDQESFWQGNDLSCWNRGIMGFQYFPTLTISLAASANETIKLVVSPRQYLRLVSNSERYSVNPNHDCYRVSISASESGVYFIYIILVHTVGYIKCGLLLQMSHVAWSVCLSVCLCVGHVDVLCKSS